MFAPNNNLNANLQAILNMKKQGKNPQAVMQSMFQQNPQMQQQLTQLKNMANGRNPREFIMQMAIQNGVEASTIEIINQILGN